MGYYTFNAYDIYFRLSKKPFIKFEPCPCINWIDAVIGDCPTDRCIVNEDCAHFSARDCNGELTGITTFDVIAAF